MAGSDFNVEQVRQAAARHLPAACHDDFLRLSRTLLHGPAFQWLLVDAPDEGLRKRVMTALEEVLRAADLSSNSLPLSERITDVAVLEARLVKNARVASVVHVIGRPGWFDAARWRAFNVRRERLASEARARLVFWLDADAIALVAREAPDLWAWRGGIYAFVPAVVPAHSVDFASMAGASGGPFPVLSPEPVNSDNRSMAERSRRVAEIRTWLARKPAPPDELLRAPLDELGNLLFDLGDYEAALEHWRNVELPLYERLGNEREKTITLGRIADVLQARGELDAALRIRKEEQLPIHDRLGDVRSKAVTMGQIADILQARGQLDEALRIREEEQLPVFERLGDVRERAWTMDKIADILLASGQFDEALRIRKDEQLPHYGSLGFKYSEAVHMGKIADILQARGQLEEALRIRQEEQLPVFERLGDVRSKAVTIGKIADILQVRGQLDEALRIRKEEELPAYERLGDVRAKALTQVKIGLQLLDAGGAAADGARELFKTAWADLQRMGLPEADLVAEEMRRRGWQVGDLASPTMTPPVETQPGTRVHDR